MNSRSLLDYLAENETTELAGTTGAAGGARPTAELIERRLAELESRLAAARQEPAPTPPPADETFSSQIESILRRHREHVEQGRAERALAEQRATQPYPRMDMPAPPLAAELLPRRAERSAEFTKFVEAVHLIGQAANRFLQTPAEPVRQAIAAPEPARLQPSAQAAAPGTDTTHLASVLRETLAAFQVMTSDLVNAAGEIRRAADMPRAEPAAQPQAEPQSRRISREDAELFRLQDDLEDLRDRLGAMTRRRSRDSY